MFHLTVFLLFTLAPAWVYWDATANRIGKLPGKSSDVGFSARGWALGTLVAMFIFLPLYLFRRPMLLARAQQHPANRQWRKLKSSVFAIIGAAIFGLNVATASPVSNEDQTGAQSLAAAMPFKQGRIGELALICNSPEALVRSLDNFPVNLSGSPDAALDKEHCDTVPEQHYVDIAIDTSFVKVIQGSHTGEQSLKIIQFTSGSDETQLWAFADTATFNQNAR